MVMAGSHKNVQALTNKRVRCAMGGRFAHRTPKKSLKAVL
jgi:hypothetical protein